jgi:hypothetical protein
VFDVIHAVPFAVLPAVLDGSFPIPQSGDGNDILLESGNKMLLESGDAILVE